MNRPKTADKLPATDAFWDQVDNESTKDFHNACVLDMIRGFQGDSKLKMMELITKLKITVQLMDLPAEMYADKIRQEAAEAAIRETEGLLND